MILADIGFNSSLPWYYGVSTPSVQVGIQKDQITLF